jgi:high affinity Mn2+ porin
MAEGPAGSPAAPGNATAASTPTSWTDPSFWTFPGAGDTWTLHTQATVVDQGHFGFPSPYEGTNSLTSASQIERTFSFSLFLGRRLWDGAAVIYNPEIFQGHGLAGSFGAAGFPNGEAVKSGFPNFHYNTSRLYLRQVIGLGGGKEKIENDVNQLAEAVDVNRLVISVGKFAASDFFDGNAYSHDARSQFLNWALWESAAWDYPADVVGYTAGAVIEWNTQTSTWHYGLFMEPRVSNGVQLDPHLTQAYGQILQYDCRYTLDGHAGTVRPFVFWNHARMGSYALADNEPYPSDITDSRAYRSKEGFGVSWDQALTADLGGFVRLSWDDGRTESFAFTEIDRSVAAGLSDKGSRWGRPDDTLGVAVAVNGIVSEHQRYLENGGLGLLLGDGALSYGPEEILETYYSWRVCPGVFLSPDYQYLEHPGYNRARGGVAVYSLRAHVAF